MKVPTTNNNNAFSIRYPEKIQARMFVQCGNRLLNSWIVKQDHSMILLRLIKGTSLLPYSSSSVYDPSTTRDKE